MMREDSTLSGLKSGAATGSAWSGRSTARNKNGDFTRGSVFGGTVFRCWDADSLGCEGKRRSFSADGVVISFSPHAVKRAARMALDGVLKL